MFAPRGMQGWRVGSLKGQGRQDGQQRVTAKRQVLAALLVVSLGAIGRLCLPKNSHMRISVRVFYYQNRNCTAQIFI